MRAAITTVIATALAMLVLASIALGSGSERQGSATRSLLAIKSVVSTQQADGEYKGRFVLEVDGVIEDSGMNFVRPANGPLHTVDGQLQTPVLARTSLTGKKGTLGLLFRGVGIAVNNPDPTKDAWGIEYGTWTVASGTGIYKGWKGGGRWANSYNPRANLVEWDGHVTH